MTNLATQVQFNLPNYFIMAISQITILLFALIAGFFFAFSVDVMRGLDLISPFAAIEAMQGINAAVRNPVFFVTFFLTPVFAVLAAYLLLKANLKKSGLLMGFAATLYLVGAFLPTTILNVPMNEALALVEPTHANANDIWEKYSSDWTFWNTIRAVVSSISVLLASLSMTFLGTVKSQ